MYKEKRTSCILPGSYDPVTLGHLDIIRRAALEYDEVYAVIFTNPQKSYTFSLSDRVRMLMLACEDIENCMVSYSDGLVIDYMREHGIEVIVKGVRNESDLAYENAQADWNKAHGGYDTVYMNAGEGFENISSTEARERIARGEGLDGILPKTVIDFLNRH